MATLLVCVRVERDLYKSRTVHYSECKHKNMSEGLKCNELTPKNLSDVWTVRVHLRLKLLNGFCSTLRKKYIALEVSFCVVFQ